MRKNRYKVITAIGWLNDAEEARRIAKSLRGLNPLASSQWFGVARGYVRIARTFLKGSNI